jgi:pimeloyl-ACP methyl ester carboxylesterase
MKIYTALFVLLTLVFTSCTEEPVPETRDPDPFPVNMAIPAPDGLNINANVYDIDKDAPVIVLCHQARFNKHEYDGIGERLNTLGFNCIAIDQRSGGPITDKQNWTNIRARQQGLDVDYLDAEQDIVAAVEYAAELYKGKLILWGSSYSSTLALYVGMANDNVDAVVSFSPGDYFAPERQSLAEMLPNFKKPMFVTSSKREVEDLTALLARMTLGENQVHFAPDSSGYHGSKALWQGQPDGEEYWEAVEGFLENVK